MLSNDHSNPGSYLERLEPHLEAFVVPCRAFQDRLDG